MQIAVTGARGRIGQAVVDVLASSGHDVVSIDRLPAERPQGSVHCVDLTGYDETVRVLDGCDAVVHLAAITGPGLLPDDVVHNNNVVMSYNVLRAAAELGIGRVCQASSVNAIGGRFSRRPRYDYFPVDEQHPTYAEDPYSLSKWFCEQQADAMTRRFEDLSVASLRLHGVAHTRGRAASWVDLPDSGVVKQLWGYTTLAAAARACLAGVVAEFAGHVAMHVVAPDTMVDTPTAELLDRHYPDVPVRSPVQGNQGLFDCSRARSVLGWVHDVEGPLTQPIQQERR
jgi:UDP-glucose 4-epimerase